MEFQLLDEEMVLFPQKAIFWKRHRILLLADLHLGKINHFRRSGIPVPSAANDRNIELLIELIQLARPLRIVCLGDLFHSHYNPEWEVFGEVVKHFASVSFELVIGNHDIMSEHQYLRKNIRLHDTLTVDRFIFTHHPLDEVPAGFYNLAGHIHPAVSLHGRGRQSVTLPCFYFGADKGYVPAFGLFTGLARIEPAREDRVFVVAENRILCVS